MKVKVLIEIEMEVSQDCTVLDVLTMAEDTASGCGPGHGTRRTMLQNETGQLALRDVNNLRLPDYDTLIINAFPKVP